MERRLARYRQSTEHRYEHKYHKQGVESFCWTCLAFFRSRRALFTHLQQKPSHICDYRNIECCGNSFNVANKQGVSLLGYHLAFTKPCHVPAGDYSNIECCGISFKDNWDRYLFHVCNDRPRHTTRAVRNALLQCDHKMKKQNKLEARKFLGDDFNSNTRSHSCSQRAPQVVDQIVDIIDNLTSNRVPSRSELKTECNEFGQIQLTVEIPRDGDDYPFNRSVVADYPYSPAPQPTDCATVTDDDSSTTSSDDDTDDSEDTQSCVSNLPSDAEVDDSSYTVIDSSSDDDRYPADTSSSSSDDDNDANDNDKSEDKSECWTQDSDDDDDAGVVNYIISKFAQCKLDRPKSAVAKKLREDMSSEDTSSEDTEEKEHPKKYQKTLLPEVTDPVVCPVVCPEGPIMVNSPQ